jgi:two-component system sensor histidine kinase KdpD
MPAWVTARKSRENRGFVLEAECHSRIIHAWFFEFVINSRHFCKYQLSAAVARSSGPSIICEGRAINLQRQHRKSVRSYGIALRYTDAMRAISASPIFANLPTHSRTRAFVDLAINLAIFFGATAATYFCQTIDRPISAALIYLAGVTVISARAGLTRGIIAALAATLIYSFLLTEPVYEFGGNSSDHLVPLVAFNLSAILSGALVGRLNDRALAAGNAKQRNAFLLQVSSDLQKTLSLDDVGAAAQRWVPFRQVSELELYVDHGGRLAGLSGAGKWHAAARAAYDAEINASPPLDDASVRVKVLHSAQKPIAVAVFALDHSKVSLMPDEDLDGFVNLLNIAIERCLLMEQLAGAEAVQKSEVLKTAILSSVSHDLRSPLTAIEASATSMLYLADTLKSEDKTAMLQTILEQCERLNRYTSNILYMGQLQYGISEDQIEDVDVVDILGAVIQSVRSLFPALKIQKKLAVTAADVGLANVRANPVMLEQMFFNIIENAAKYGRTEQGILITAKPSGDIVQISIIDWGPGIPAEEQPRVFENFYRADRTPRGDGNGLGLAIAKGFAEAFGGTIEVLSPHSRGPGTEMLISLPIARHSKKAPKP